MTTFVPELAHALQARDCKGVNKREDANTLIAFAPQVAYSVNSGAGRIKQTPGMDTLITFNAFQGMDNPMTASVFDTLAVAHDTAVLAPTLEASGAGASRPAGVGSEPDFCVPTANMKVRRLTVTECEVLQGFPKGWTSGRADGPRYKQMGNAVTVNVAEWIGRRIVNREAGASSVWPRLLPRRSKKK